MFILGVTKTLLTDLCKLILLVKFACSLIRLTCNFSATKGFKTYGDARLLMYGPHAKGSLSWPTNKNNRVFVEMQNIKTEMHFKPYSSTLDNELIISE